MGTCIEKLPHSCGSKRGLQVFEVEGGGYNGYCFACSTFVPNPYEDKPADYKPTFIRKSNEEVTKEVAAIKNYKVVGLPLRKLREESLAYFGVKIGVSEEDGETPTMHYYPYTQDGELVGWKCRHIETKKMWGMGETSDVDLFGWDLAIRTGQKKLIITEGELDAVAFYQIYKDLQKHTQYAETDPAVVSLPHGAGSAGRDIAKYAASIGKFFKEVVLAFDMDDPGQKASEEVLKVLPGATVAALPDKDINACLLAGRSKQCFNSVFFNSQKPKNTRIVSCMEVADKARKPVEWGFSWPYKKLTDLTRGIRLGETYYLGAGVKLGKSELLNDLAAHMIKEHGWKVFVAKPEEANHRTLQGVVGKLQSRIFHDPKIEFDHEAFNRGLEIVKDKLFLLNLYQELSLETLKADIRSAASDGCKAVFIDPITVLSNGVDAAAANTLLQKMAQELAQMAMDLNIVILMFAHLKAPDNGPAHERGGAVQSHQFAGSRAMMRSANLMIGLEGNKDPDLPEEQRNIRQLVVLENRMSGETGKVALFYDKNTGAFNEL